MKHVITVLIFSLTFVSNVFAEKINIVTTIGQITDVVQNIGGEHVNVQGLMGAGVDPHLYKATESDVLKLSNADVIFYNGLFLEAKMESVFEKMAGNKVVVPLGEATDVDNRLESVDYAGHYDPHIWFNVGLWSVVANKIGTTLAEHDPDHADVYLANAKAYQEKLNALDDYVQSKASELSNDQRILVTAHDAFRYFGAEYDFEVVGLQGLSTESEAGTKDVIGLADFITERKIKAIFVESSVPVRNIKAVQDAVRARGWNVEIGGELFSDAMGDEGTVEGTYIGMVTYNIDTIVNALK